MKNKIKKAEESFQVKEHHGAMTIKCNVQLCTGLYIFVCAKNMHAYIHKGKKENL